MFGAVVLLGLSILYAQCNACNEGWIPYSDSCYLFADQKLQWTQAQVVCELYKSNLADIATEEENSFIVSFLKKHSFGSVWVGGSDLVNEDQWTWLPDHKLLTFEDWYSGEPNGHDEDCLELRSGWFYGYKWNDESCSTKNKFVCEKKNLKPKSRRRHRWHRY